MVIRQPNTSLINSPEINRLLSAAVINPNFCKLLLADPARALAIGFNGEKFHLAPEERSVLLSIQASDLAEFAKQLLVYRPVPFSQTRSNFANRVQPNKLPAYAAGLD